MTSWASVGAAVVVLGIVLASPPVVFIGAAVLIVRVLAQIWPRRVLEALEYSRQASPDRTVVGDAVEVRASLWNRTRLPVPWASATDTLDQHLRATTLDGRAVNELHLAGSLRPYERVARRFLVTPTRRGLHEIGPPRLRVAELFGTHSPLRDTESEPLRILARPLSVPVSGLIPASAPLARRLARRSLFTDPNLFAGVRPFQAGDPLKSVHWRASARLGSTQTKRFEPSLSGPAVLVFDVQTLPGDYWMLHYDEQLFEQLAVATLSVARELIRHENACGLAAAAFTGSGQTHLYLPPRADRPQIGRIADALARLSQESSVPLGHLLAWLPRRLAAGTMIVVLTARSGATSAAVVRRLEQSGFPVHFLVIGGDEEVAETRRMGLAARAVRIDSEGGQPRAVAIAG